MQKLKIRRPDDWHHHFRDRAILGLTVPYANQQFHRVVVMPNLDPPITTATQLMAYRERLNKHQSHDWVPLMTAYLHPKMQLKELEQLHQAGLFALKWYPKHSTTHSEYGLTHWQDLDTIWRYCSAHHIPILIHGEAHEPGVDVFMRETLFIRDTLSRFTDRYPDLTVVLEHISTKIAVEWVQSAGENHAATITPHHLLYDRNIMLDQGIRPHWYCKPILKCQEDMIALQEIVLSGHQRFFFGSDSAPHTRSQKEQACGCAGIFNSPSALPKLLEWFHQQQQIERFEPFVSEFGAKFYRLPQSEQSLTFIFSPWTVPLTISYGQQTFIPWLAGETLAWQLQNPVQLKSEN